VDGGKFAWCGGERGDRRRVQPACWFWAGEGAMTPTRPRSAASQHRAAEAARARDQLANLMAVQRERFAASRRPVIPAPGRSDPREFATREWNRRRHEARWWQRPRRRAIRAEVAMAAQRHVDEAYAEAVRHAGDEQRRADAWWDALNAGQPAVTRAALEAAFADNPAGVYVVEADGPAATLAVRLPQSSVLPERSPHVTPTGKLTTKAWTQTEFNNAYADLLGAHLLITLRQTWAVAPSLQQARVIGILDAEPVPAVLFDVTAGRAAGQWNDDTHGQALLAAAPHGLRRAGRTRAIHPWPSEQLGTDVAAWVRQSWTFGGRPQPVPAPQLSTVGHPQDAYAAAPPSPPAPPRPPAFTPVDGPPPRNRSRWGRAVTFLAAHPTSRAGLNWAIWATAAIVLLVVIASASSSPKTTPAANRAISTRTGPATAPVTAATQPATPPASPAAGSATPPATVPASGSPRPGDSTGGVRVLAPGVVLPDPARTPGATNPAVTQATIATTICVSGWTATIRPPSSYTTTVKDQQLASGYAYHRDQNPADYEEDHLIPLELGGAPRSIRNLWPEPYHVTDGAYSKDKIENKLHALVCAGSLSLGTARHAIATNWVAAYQRYISVSTAAPSTSYRPAPTTTQVAPPQTTAAAAPAGATAICNDGSYSYSQHRSGTCSHHGGVREWL
jgi:hypothetical protein